MLPIAVAQVRPLICEETAVVFQGYPGDFIAADLGYAGCRPVPTTIQVTSPIAVSGMPTDMRSDASGSALQPALDSDAWVRLVTIRGFKPVLPASFGCGSEWFKRCGVLKNDFAIAPPSQLLDSPTRANGAIPEVLIEIGIPKDILLDITGRFTTTSRVCCPIISLSIVSFVDAADAGALTATAGQGSAVSPNIPVGFSLPSSFSSMTLSSPSVAVVPFAPKAPGMPPGMLQPHGSYGSYGNGLYGYGPLSALSSPGPPASHSQQRPPVNLISQIPVPPWLSAQIELNYSDPSSQKINAWQYIRISRAVPVTAIRQYAVAVLAQNPGSNLTSALLFNLDVVDFYQLRTSLALGGIRATGLSPAQQAAFETGVSAAFNLSTSQVSLGAPTSQQRMLLQSSGYVLIFSITGLNGRKKALALATSLEQSVKNGQPSRSLGSSGDVRLSL